MIHLLRIRGLVMAVMTMGIFVSDSAQGGCVEGQFSQKGPDCTVYQWCVHGAEINQRCPSGLYWNPQINVCDWARNVNCPFESDSVTATTTILSTTSSTSIPSTTFSIAPSTRSRGRSLTLPPDLDTNNTIISTVTSSKPTRATRSTVKTTKSSKPSKYKVICYYTNWSWYRQGDGKYAPSDIDIDLCTHIIFGFATLDSSQLTMRVFDTWSDTDEYGPKLYAKVTSLKVNGIKVLIALGGWNDSQGDKYSRLVNDPEARKHFIDNAVTFIEQYGFDGLDLDWEYPKCWQVNCNAGPSSDKEGFTAWVSELRAAFNPKGWLLSAAVSPSKTVIDAAYDVPSISRDLDWIGVMTYDYHGHWDKKTGHLAPLYQHPEAENKFFNVNYTLNYWIQMGAEPLKIIMGFPLYGQSFTLTDPISNNSLNAPSSGTGLQGPLTRQAGFLAYYEICKDIADGGWTVVRDAEGTVGPYAHKGNQWVSYDDVAMIRKKAKVVKALRLGGAMIWALDLDDFRNRCECVSYPLLKTINHILRKYPAAPSSKKCLSSSSISNKKRTD